MLETLDERGGMLAGECVESTGWSQRIAFRARTLCVDTPVRQPQKIDLDLASGSFPRYGQGPLGTGLALAPCGVHPCQPQLGNLRDLSALFFPSNTKKLQVSGICSSLALVTPIPLAVMQTKFLVPETASRRSSAVHRVSIYP